jgi:hypothetical protein
MNAMQLLPERIVFFVMLFQLPDTKIALPSP